MRNVLRLSDKFENLQEKDSNIILVLEKITGKQNFFLAKYLLFSII